MATTDPPSTPTTTAVSSIPPQPDQSTRLRRQRGLFFGGAAFVVFSTLITRRALARRYRVISSVTSPSTNASLASTIKNSKPRPPLSNGVPSSSQAAGYESAVQASASGGGSVSQELQRLQLQKESIAAAAESSGPIVAVEALTIATLNVFSWAIMVTGGVLWYFDIASIEDMRKSLRKGLGGLDEKEAEEEMEEWIASVLARKEDKERRRAGAGEESLRGEGG